MLKRITLLSCIASMSFTAAAFAQTTSSFVPAGPGVSIAGSMERQSIGLKGVENARQLGGYVTKDGRTVKDGVLLRSGKLSDPTEEDLKRLKETYGLTQIIDFRTTDEISKSPDTAMDGVTNTQVRILDESNPDSTATTAMVGIYSENPAERILKMLENGIDKETMYSDVAADPYSQNGYKEFFDKLLSTEDGAVLWHCTGGKDRAGTASVLLLSALGVDRETIIKDFALTNEFYADKINYMGEQAQLLTDDQSLIEGVKTLTGVDASYMEYMLDDIDSKYGSMDNYLRQAIGLSDEDIQKLQDKYLY